MAAKNIKIFIASAGEVRAEREKAILLLNDLRKAHKHLDLEAVQWEYDTVPGSQPGFESVQDAINPKLEQSHIAVFIFYSRIGHYTKVEFDLAQELGKKFFVLFKEGFSPKDEEIAAYSDLLKFKKSLNKNILHEPYTDEKDFYSRLYRSLNVYLYETYPAMAGPLPDEVLKLLRDLAQKEYRIKELEGLLPASTSTDELQKLAAEIATIKNELAQSEALRQQQAADKAALEQQLATQRENDQLKAQALEAVEKGDYATAENLLQESAKDSIAATASTFYELAEVKKLQLKYREAFVDFELAASITPKNSEYLHEAGQMANRLGYADKAIAYYEKSLPLAITEYGQWHSEIATLYNDLGEAYYSMGKYDHAIGYYEQALDIDRSVHGERHPDIAIRYNNLGSAYNSKREYDIAIGYYDHALDIGKEFYGNRHPDIAIYYNNLGLAYDSKGEYDRAIGYYERALEIDQSVHGERHPQIATYYNNLGEAYRSKCEYDRAIGYYERALDIDRSVYGNRHPKIAIRYNNLGSAYYSKSAYDIAIGYYEQCLSILHEFLPQEHPYIATTQKNLQAAKEAQAKSEKE